MIVGGRGSGKTRAGAEWIRRLAGNRPGPLLLVGETITEAIEVMVKGPSGVLRVHPPEERPVLRGHTLTWANGTEAMILGASDPERFRGPQFAAAWCDELGKWPKAEAAWDMLQFGLRLGDRPQQLVTTTPRATRLMKRLMAEPETVITPDDHAGERALAGQSLPQGDRRPLRWLGAGAAGARGRTDRGSAGCAVDARHVPAWRGDALPGRIVVAVDPPVTGHKRSDACGIVVAGRARRGRGGGAGGRELRASGARCLGAAGGGGVP